MVGVLSVADFAMTPFISPGQGWGLEERVEPAHRPDLLADERAQRDADDRGERIADPDPLEARREMPEQPLI